MLLRFTEISASLDARVQDGVTARLRQAIGLGASLGHRVNETMHDQALAERTTSALVDAIRPGTLPFALLVLLVLLLGVHVLLVRRDADRILEQHGHFLRNHHHEGRPHAE